MVAAVLVVLMSSSLELELESVALMGAATGAVVALVPDRSPVERAGSFLLGFVAAWIAYLVRAALLPDSTGGRAVAVALVVALCVAGAAVSMQRLPLWGTLLGAATMAGSFEATYLAAPPQVLETSLSTSTSVLLNVAIGFLAAALVAGASKAMGSEDRTRKASPAPGGDDTKIDSLMEEAR
ncbi:membrane hypothetical protein [metagenome]|uniref:DUF1097 domain-containing protein n=1 Tax=metagenome TaxID=256318 RepID=A0A2P2BWF5_9ZZZZ